MNGTIALLEAQVSQTTRWHFLVLDGGPNGVSVGECSDSGLGRDALVRQTEEFVASLRGRDLIVDRAEISAALVSKVEDLPVDHRFGPATVTGGIDQMLCDLAARDAGMPLWRWLGADEPRTVPLYANINRMAGARDPDEVARMAKQAVAAGFSAIKCAPFDVPHESIPRADIGLARLRAVRAAIGDDVELRVDAHHHIDFPSMLGILPELENLGVAWLEDAVHVTDVVSQRALREATSLPLAGGEQAFSPAMTQKAVDEGLIDILMPDVKHVGGVHRLLEVARSAPGLQISPHNPAGPVATAASAHVFSVCDSATTLEFAFGEVEWRSGLVGGHEQVHRGQLEVSDRPGLGLELDLSHPSLSTLWSITL